MQKNSVMKKKIYAQTVRSVATKLILFDL